MRVSTRERLAVAFSGRVFVGSLYPRLPAKTYFGNVHFHWKRGKIAVMSGGLIERFLSSCRHQFAWPRRAENGDYYQLCVHCGTKYLYDWGKMRRLSLAEDEEDSAAGQVRSSGRKCGTRVAWMPRERRLRHRVSVQFRLPGAAEWVEATSENISRSGLLFRHTAPLQVGTELHLVFEMPEELAGHCPARAFCMGSVVRVTAETASRKQKHSFLIACAINNCELKAQQAG
jgi:PilZ domain